jgi:beta-1,4-mannosyltransferase
MRNETRKKPERPKYADEFNQSHGLAQKKNLSKERSKSIGENPLKQRNKLHACLIVLGDFMHSPRMQNHALELIKCGFYVTVISYTSRDRDRNDDQNSSSEAISSTSSKKAKREKKLLSENLRFVRVQKMERMRFVPNVLYFMVRIIAQFWQCLVCLVFEQGGRGRYSYVMTQCPPGMPTFMACAVYKRFFNEECTFVIDWHNLGYSLFALGRKRGEKDFLVRVMKVYERVFLKHADEHIAVTAKMKEFLCNEWAVDERKCLVLRDAPSAQFLKLNKKQTREKKRGFRRKTPNVVNVVSSTSWTPDEDFDVLLAAVVLYDKLATSNKKTNKKEKLPFLNILITGKGALRESFERRAEEAKLKSVSFSYAWLPINEYPERLAMSDVGLCLHQSSSKLDLPMKIVDMFGVGIPVIARRYPCLSEELVEENVNGVTFETSEELCDVLVNILKGWNGEENGTKALQNLERGVWRENLKVFGDYSNNNSNNNDDDDDDDNFVDFWEENWNDKARFIFISDKNAED